MHSDKWALYEGLSAAQDRAEAIRQDRSSRYRPMALAALPDLDKFKSLLAQHYSASNAEAFNAAAAAIVAMMFGRDERKNDLEEMVNADPDVIAARAEVDRASAAVHDYRTRNPSRVEALYEQMDELAEAFGDRAAELALTAASSPLEMLQKAEILAIVLEDSDVTPADFLDLVRFDVEAITGERYSPLPRSVRIDRKYRPEAGRLTTARTSSPALIGGAS